MQRQTDQLPTGLSDLPEHRFGFDEARHLLNRAGFGGTPEQVELLASWGLERSVDYLLDVGDVPFRGDEEAGFSSSIMRPATEAEQAAYRRAQRERDEDALAAFRRERQNRQRQDRQQVRRMQLWWLKRMIETPRPLEEKMTLLWHGHFATSYRKVEDSWHMFQQNQMFRRHALGGFDDLLAQIVRDPAMIAYLDNQRSSTRQPNENLARELMELFSLGEGNYSENDIKEGARALTGYTFRDDAFYFDEGNHDTGSKLILGKRGQFNGDDFVRILLGRSDTADFVARKLYCHFAADVPESFDEIESSQRRFISALGGSLGRSGYQLRPTLKKLFTSEHFYHPEIVGQKIKSPVELVVGSIRSLRTPVRDLSVLLDSLDLMGQNPLFPPSVKGWSGGRAWISTSTLFVRQNILNFLLTGKLPRGYDALANSEKFESAHLLEPLERTDPMAARDPDRVAEYLLRFLIGGTPAGPSETIRSFLREVAGDRPGRISDDAITGAVLLITAMPEYQLC